MLFINFLIRYEYQLRQQSAECNRRTESELQNVYLLLIQSATYIWKHYFGSIEFGSITVFGWASPRY